MAANPGFRPYDDDPTAPLLTPDDFDETTDEVRLILDPGPEPPPGGIRPLPATRSSTDDPAFAGIAAGTAGWLTPLRLWGFVALAVAATALIVILATVTS